MDLKNTKTEANLRKTFAGESKARTKYYLYGEKARREGYANIASIFDETAGNETAHAREAFNRFLRQNSTTTDNLMDSAMGEKDEASNIYAGFEKTAREEGFTDIADFFKELAEVEAEHEKRFEKYYNAIKEGTLYKSGSPSRWECLNCGYIYEGTEVPMNCPLCKYPRGYFIPICDED